MNRVMNIIVAALILLVTGLPAAAESITLNWGDGQSITIDTENYADDLVKIAKERQSEIESALTANEVTTTQAEEAIDKAQTEYDNYINNPANAGISTTPYTTAVNGLDDFTEVLGDVIPNTQIQQNVWANAWIGNLLPKPHFGFGINAGVSKLDLVPLIDTADALGIDMDGVPDTLVWPTITADARVGGFILPFDVGFTAMAFDSSTIGAIGNAIDPVTFDFFTIGGDVRYALLKGGTLRPKVSVGLGGYYTSGTVEVTDDSADAKLEFSSTTLVLNAQASIKALCFVPFAGARVLLTKSNVDWSVRNVQWASILSADATAIENAVAWGFLPTDFNGGSENGFFDHIRPVVYAGFGIDIFVVDITVSASYDFVSAIYSGALSVRFALN